VASIEAQRASVMASLRSSYGDGLLTTRTLELRLEAALRAGTSSALDASVWDLPRGRPVVRRAVQRARWFADVALGRVGEPEATRLVDLRPFGNSPSCRLVLGRSRSCDVTLGECASVSRRHAELSLRAGTWTLRDLGSRNGTWLGARRIEVAVLDPAVPLRLGGLEVRWTGL
jgi:hypothetical protein